MKNKLFLQISMICIWLFSCLSLIAQEDETVDQDKWAVQFNLKHQDLPFDFNFGQLRVVHNVGIRPYYSLEVQRLFQRKNPKKQFFLVGQIGHFNNLYQDRWFTIKAGLGFERTIGKKFYYSSRFEIGKVNFRNADVQYILENEKWIPTSNFSESKWTNVFATRVDIGYKLFTGKYPIDLILSGDLKLMMHPEFGAFPYYAYGGGVRYHF